MLFQKKKKKKKKSLKEKYQYNVTCNLPIKKIMLHAIYFNIWFVFDFI